MSEPSASGITLSAAILEAEVYPDFQQTKYGFEYATSEAALEEGHGMKAFGASELPVNEEEVPPTPVSVGVSGLEEHTTYYYRLVAENASSENPRSPNKGKPVIGEIASFTTESLPFVSTGEAETSLVPAPRWRARSIQRVSTRRTYWNMAPPLAESAPKRAEGGDRTRRGY